jgi:hypothetical protein
MSTTSPGPTETLLQKPVVNGELTHIVVVRMFEVPGTSFRGIDIPVVRLLIVAM